jgi:hypothetical protein
MLNRNDTYQKTVGIAGVAFEQRQEGKPKHFNIFGLEVKVSEDGISSTVIEELPEGMTVEEARVNPGAPEPEKDGPLTYDDTRNSALTIHERVRITDEKDPNYMTEEDLKHELTGRNVSFDKRMGRKKLSAILQNELGE